MRLGHTNFLLRPELLRELKTFICISVKMVVDGHVTSVLMRE
jgi:hypothetical protein